MAKGGFRLLDSDMHIIEPPELWQRYIDPAFKSQAPRGWPGPENQSVLEIAGKVMPRIAATPQAHYQTMYARKADRYRRAFERNFDPASQLEAMDTEGIDVAVLFPTRGLYAWPPMIWSRPSRLRSRARTTTGWPTSVPLTPAA